MILRSGNFLEGENIPTVLAMKAVKGGENISIALSWRGAPGGTKSFALAIVDPHPVAGNWVHWMVINIPVETGELAEGASGNSMPEGSREMENSFGTIGYGGPQPPPGSGKHPYVTTLYALDIKKLDLGERSSLENFYGALEGHVLARAEITSYYKR